MLTVDQFDVNGLCIFLMSMPMAKLFDKSILWLQFFNLMSMVYLFDVYGLFIVCLQLIDLMSMVFLLHAYS
jgi:hypothetical protein